MRQARQQLPANLQDVGLNNLTICNIFLLTLLTITPLYRSAALNQLMEHTMIEFYVNVPNKSACYR